MSIPNLQGTNLYLIGMMGSGKTTIGHRLADRFGYQFMDTDSLIERVTQQSVTQIFAESGEAIFRQLETKVLSELSGYTRKLISTGGGVVITPENWGHLRTGIVVWLDVPVSVLCDRLSKDISRPILQGDGDLKSKLNDIFTQRSILYAQADLRIAIKAHDTPEKVCDRLLSELNVACQAKAEENAKILQLNHEKPFQAH